jgi:hypothetical protein
MEEVKNYPCILKSKGGELDKTTHIYGAIIAGVYKCPFRFNFNATIVKRKVKKCQK